MVERKDALDTSYYLGFGFSCLECLTTKFDSEVYARFPQINEVCVPRL